MMIICAITAVLVAALLANIKFRFLKGLPLASLCIFTAVLIFSSGFLGYRTYHIRAREKENLYLALCYTRDGHTDAARAKLQNVPTTSRYSFVADAAMILVNRLEGYDSTAELNLTILQANYKQDADRGTIANYLRTNVQLGQAEMLTVISLLEKDLKLSNRQLEKFSGRYLIESSVYNGGRLNISLEELTARYGKEEAARLMVKYHLGTGNSSTAITQAVELAADKPNMDNRVLLAETVAQLSYGGQDISYAFADDGEDGELTTEMMALEQIAQEHGLRPANIRDREVQKLLRAYSKDHADLADLENRLTVETDPQRKQSLRDEYDKKALGLRETKSKIEYIYVYRAMNAVSGIGGIEEDALRAKLYFAAGEEDKAKDIIYDMTRAGKYLFLDDATKDALDILRIAVQQGNGAQLSDEQLTELSAALRRILSAGGSDVLSTMGEGLVTDICTSVVADIKYRQQGLTITTVDAREFPLIRAKVSANRDVMEQVRSGRITFTVRDTHTSPAFTILVDESDIDTCFVVDESGSMGGSVHHVQQALLESLQSTGLDSRVAIVGYEDTARLICEMTDDYIRAVGAVSDIHAAGGTNIQSGLAMGVDLLRDTPGVRNIILMTDGQDHMSDAMRDTLSECNLLGITVYTIGFGDVNDELLTEIAALTGGKYIKADSSQELGGVYELIQGYISNVFTVEYTATETEGEDRYFYISTEDRVSTDRSSYNPNVSTISLRPVEIQSLHSNLFRPGRDANRIPILQGTGLDRVEEILLENRACEIRQQDEGEITFALPDIDLRTGIYPVTIRWDGGETTLPSAILIGDGMGVSKFTMGNLTVQGQAVSLDSTTIAVSSGIVNDIYFSDIPIIIKTPRSYNADSARDGALALGNTGFITGDLPLYIYAGAYREAVDPGYNTQAGRVNIAGPGYNITVSSGRSDITWTPAGEEEDAA